MNNKNINLNLEHLYISPLEQCNLSCKLCYTKKTKNVLSLNEIKQFIEQFQESLLRYKTTLKTITLCGGELFLLDYITELINHICEQDIFVQVITNGTINRLHEINVPNSVKIITSIDGIEKWHDMNRGRGRFKEAVDFIKSAQKQSFHTEISSLVWKENFDDIENFEEYVKSELGGIPILYQLRKSENFLHKHPITNINNAGVDFGFLSDSQLNWLLDNRTTFPPKGLGCYQLSLMSDGNVYSCCEGVEPLLTKSEKIKVKSDVMDLIIKNYISRIHSINSKSAYCVLPTVYCDCPEPDFCCGLKTSA